MFFLAAAPVSVAVFLGALGMGPCWILVGSVLRALISCVWQIIGMYGSPG